MRNLLLLIPIIPIADIVLLVILSNTVSSQATFLITLVTAVAGILLLRTRKKQSVNPYQMQMNPSEILKPFKFTVSAILLIVPGVLTDILALLILSGFAEKQLQKILMGQLQTMMQQQMKKAQGQTGTPFGTNTMNTVFQPNISQANEEFTDYTIEDE